MRLPLLDYTDPFNASAILLLVALLLWVGIKEKKNILPSIVMITAMLILALQTVELMVNINNLELMVLLVKNIIIGQVYVFLSFGVLLYVDHRNKQMRNNELQSEIDYIKKQLAKKAKTTTKTTKAKKVEE
jgi:hypothetical protein